MKPAAEFRDHQCAAAGIFSNQVALCHLEDAVQWLWVVTVTICLHQTGITQEDVA